MPTPVYGPVSWERMIKAVEKVRERLLRATGALENAGIPYAVIGGNAVAAWVSRVDESAARNTQDVDILLRREDLEAAKAALASVGFLHRRVRGIDMFLDGPGSKARDAVRIVLAAERVRSGDDVPAPEVTEVEKGPDFRFVTLESLVRMKLTANRLKDRMHLMDMLDLDMIDGSWLPRLHPTLSARLKELIDNPEDLLSIKDEAGDLCDDIRRVNPSHGSLAGSQQATGVETNSEKGGGPLTASKFSGLPWLAVDEDWPECEDCQLPMQLFLQLNLAELPPEYSVKIGTGLLQFFYCVREVCEQMWRDDWEPFSSGKLLRVVQPEGNTPTPKNPVRKGYFPAKQIDGWQIIDDYPPTQEHEELGLRYDYDFKKNTVRVKCSKPKLDVGGLPQAMPEDIAVAASGDKLGGWPNWVHGAEYPQCTRCKKRMTYVFQIDSEDNQPYMFGDVGGGHITQCPTHKEVLGFGWACC